MIDFKNSTYIDLFSGIGGFHQAMDSMGAKCVFASEWDKDCQDTYETNYGIRPMGDITQITAEDIPSHDVLCAGFPCQAFSISGKQKGFADTRGTLFFDVLRIAEFHRPKLLFLENVKNFARHDGGRTLKVVEASLQELGYRVFHQILNASNFAVPHKRERLYILAFRDDLNVECFSFPSSAGQATKLIDYCLDDAETCDYIIHRNDIVMKGEQDVKPDSLGNYLQKSIRIGTVNKGGQGERVYHSYGHAITLSAYGGGVGAKTGLYLINGKIRRLAPRECARIMGFSDDFILSKNKNISYRQFGNSVVVNVLKAILESISKQAPPV